MSSKGLDALLALPSTSLLPRDGKDGAADVKSTATLGDLRDAKATVYDFWTTRCTNCPAALDALNSIALVRPSVAFVAVNIDDAGAARELISQAASEGRWTSLAHVHLGEDEKERAKDILGMRTVPFYVVVGEDGKVLRHGSAKTLPLKTVESLDSALLPPAAGAADGATARVGCDGKSQQDENDAAAANAAPTPPGEETAAATDNGTPRGKATHTARMECVGDVCKLVRMPKAAVAPAAPAPQGQATGESAAEATVAAAASGPAAAPAASAAAAAAAAAPSPATGMECDGGVCKLVRKPKKTAEPGKEESKDDSVAAVAGASAPAPAPAALTMECEGGVCKLVRKPKKAPEEEQPAVAVSERERKEEASESPLVVGDAMPPLQVGAGG
ncbi:unnamed protein product [Ectocarpus fasciculatus]